MKNKKTQLPQKQADQIREIVEELVFHTLLYGMSIDPFLSHNQRYPDSAGNKLMNQGMILIAYVQK